MTYRNPNLDEFAHFNLDSPVFGADSIIRKCHGVWGITLGIGTRALVIQALNPIALTGLLLSNPKLMQEPTQRTMRTQKAMETIYWGTWREAIAVTNHVGEMHTRVRGKVGPSAGSIPADTVYSALDSRVQKWIIAAIIDSAVACYPMFMGTALTSAEKDQLVREYSTVAALFGVKPKDRWSNYWEFSAYFNEMMSTLNYSSFDEYAEAMRKRNGAEFQADPRAFLELTEDHRQVVLQQTLHPGNAIVEMFQSNWALFVNGILPHDVRSIYKLSWTYREIDGFACIVRMVRCSIDKARLTQVGATAWSLGAMCNPLAWWTIPIAAATGATVGNMIHGPILYRRGNP